MLEAQHQHHLKNLKKELHKAVSDLKQGESVYFSTGWAQGNGYCPNLPHFTGWSGKESFFVDCPRDLHLLVNPDFSGSNAWTAPIPESLHPLLRFYWPGPLLLRVKLGFALDGSAVILTYACPWHPIARELVERSGPLIFEVGDTDKGRKVSWPDTWNSLKPTILDISTIPWRVTEHGFVDYDDLKRFLPQPAILSLERATPHREIRTFVPEGLTLVLESQDREPLLLAIRTLRDQVPADHFVRVYLDEATAHQEFPDDREVRVYGELHDLERVRRRLQAMLERQSRRSGKRILLIAVYGLGVGSESFRADLEKFSDRWIRVDLGQPLLLEERSDPVV